MRKVFATLRAVVEVMEYLSKDAAPDGVGRLIKEEVIFPFISLYFRVCIVRNWFPTYEFFHGLVS